MKKIINQKQPEIKIIIVNTSSFKQLSLLMLDIMIYYPLVIDLLFSEPPYKLPEDETESFIGHVVPKLLFCDLGLKMH